MRVFRVDLMAARVWQSSVRRLTTQSGESHYNVSKILNECSFSNTRREFLRRYSEFEDRTRGASGELWTQRRIYNVDVGGGNSCGGTLIGEELRSKNLGGTFLSAFSRWGSAMQSSTLPSHEEDASQDPPSDSSSLKNDVERSEFQEFVPENVDIPRTPLVQAIREAQDEEVSESVSPSSGASPGEIPPSEREIDPVRLFVGDLPFDAKGEKLKQDLCELFGNYGTVEDIRLASHRKQSKRSTVEGKHRGFAFVVMSSPEEAQAAIKELNGKTFLGRSITVSFGLKPVEPVPLTREQRMNNAARLARCKVFVGNLHEDTTLETVENRCKQYGTVTSSKLIYDLGTKKSRGFGFIMFETEAEAMKAILDLDGSILDGSVIRVNIAKYPQSV